jgi:hypothetical protein
MAYVPLRKKTGCGKQGRSERRLERRGKASGTIPGKRRKRKTKRQMEMSKGKTVSG